MTLLVSFVASFLWMPAMAGATKSYTKQEAFHQLQGAAKKPVKQRAPHPMTLTYVNEQPGEAVLYVINPLLKGRKVEGIKHVLTDVGLSSESPTQIKLPSSVGTVLVYETNGEYWVAFPPAPTSPYSINLRPHHFYMYGRKASSPTEVNLRVQRMLLMDVQKGAL